MICDLWGLVTSFGFFHSGGVDFVSSGCKPRGEMPESSFAPEGPALALMLVANQSTIRRRPHSGRRVFGVFCSRGLRPELTKTAPLGRFANSLNQTKIFQPKTMSNPKRCPTQNDVPQKTMSNKKRCSTKNNVESKSDVQPRNDVQRKAILNQGSAVQPTAQSKNDAKL